MGAAPLRAHAPLLREASRQHRLSRAAGPPAQALAHGVKLTGCTIHFVDTGVDSGPIIFQSPVAVRDDDDAASLHRRIQAEEHRLLPRATALLAAGRLHRDGRRVRVS